MTFIRNLLQSQDSNLSFHPLQIAQFFFNVFYNLNALFRIGEACRFPLWMMKLSSWYNASFIFLFGKFYLKSYSQETKKLKNA